MGKPQYISDATFVGAPSETSPIDLNPRGAGVDFTQTPASVTIPFASGITPIVVEVSIPNTNTNVNQISVVITAPNGRELINQVSPSGSNTVTLSPLIQLPEDSNVTVSFQTPKDEAPKHVTLSIIACYTPSTGTTFMTSGSTTPYISSTTPIVTITSTSGSVTSGTGMIFLDFSTF